jgi:hypothetical protein
MRLGIVTWPFEVILAVSITVILIAPFTTVNTCLADKAMCHYFLTFLLTVKVYAIDNALSRRLYIWQGGVF